jgi:hypothetical protein
MIAGLHGVGRALLAGKFDGGAPKIKTPRTHPIAQVLIECAPLIRAIGRPAALQKDESPPADASSWVEIEQGDVPRIRLSYRGIVIPAQGEVRELVKGRVVKVERTSSSVWLNIDDMKAAAVHARAALEAAGVRLSPFISEVRRGAGFVGFVAIIGLARAQAPKWALSAARGRGPIMSR